ncbi:DUF6427 family protein [Aequorivita sp. Q41]|uniref:DUF6427 family protein n=1 Tax=Aequorivita sp. Q41 TaxID=3153300 RepID=UPI003242A2C3
MLTRFFGKSNPINYLILGIFIIAGYLGILLKTPLVVSAYQIFLHVSFIILSVLSMWLLDFIIRKNSLTKNNTYAILFFTCFMGMLPVIFLQPKILLANAFLILALRRIMSLHSDKNSTKKILDTSIWISLASLFYFWSLLFFVPLWIAIIQKPNTNYKQMLMPFIGFLAIFSITTAYHLLVNDSIAWIFNWQETINLDFSKYNSLSVLVPVTVILAFYIWTGMFRVLKLSAFFLKMKSNYLLLLYVSIICVFIALAGPEKTGAELLFILAPVSIIAANYIEKFEAERSYETDAIEFWFKEALLWLVVILPFVFLFL